MNRYTIKDSHGEIHLIDADALNIIDGCLSFSKKGSPGLIAQFKDWHSYKVQPIDEPAPVVMTPFVPFDPPKLDAASLEARELVAAMPVAKRQYNKKA